MLDRRRYHQAGVWLISACLLFGSMPASAADETGAPAADSSAPDPAAGAGPTPAVPADSTAVPEVAGAGSESDAPSIETWLAEIQKQELEGEMPHRVVFVSDMPEKGMAKLVAVDAAKFNALGYFQTVAAKNVEWDYKLNRSKFAKLSAFTTLLQLTGADTVILVPKAGPWSVMREGPGGKSKLMVKVKGPASKSASDLVDWLPNALGWDGVVLAQKDDYLLVASTAKILSASQIQALAVDKSDTKFSLKDDERKGAGLLSSNVTKGGVGVFDIVFLGQGVKKLAVGTKLIIEKKK